MTTERWERVKELFERVRTQEPNVRAAILKDVCRDDDELRSEIESLLEFFEEAGTFLENPAIGDAAPTAPESFGDAMVGRRIGPYILARRIGQGGMGTVYLAARADEQYRKRVAIKLVKPGGDNVEIIRRFQAERQALAVLDHANIVKLLDGGSTEDGIPYLVMGYVEGTPIDAYCDIHKLSISDRLALFRTVCAAVHYAHQNLVVHRDLKPSNILVTADGAPMLLDFGIAKLLKPEMYLQPVNLTRTGVRPMTPKYASPEQIRGEPITTASDVYSLGVVLYELLTGQSPYRLKQGTPVEIEQAVCLEEPQKPSTAAARRDTVPVSEATTLAMPRSETVTEPREGNINKLRKRLSGDLDTILLMALRKEPQRRYASVEQFSEDIRRHMDGLPVIARKATLRYLCGKFIRRHKAGVAAAVAVAVTLLAGLIGTTWEARVASGERARAERRFQDARQLVHSFIYEFDDAIKDLSGSISARKLVVQRGLEYLDELTKDPSSDASLQLEQAEAYLRIGDVQGNPYYPHLGDPAGALTSYRKAQSIIEFLSPTNSKDQAVRRALAHVYEKSGYVLSALGKPQEAVANLRNATAIYELLAAAEPKNAQAHLEAATCYNGFGDLLGNGSFLNIGDKTSAFENYNKALTHYEAAVVLDDKNPKAKRGLAIGYFKLGDMHLQVAGGEPAQALEMFRKALAIFKELSAGETANADFRRSTAVVQERIAQTLVEMGRFQEASEYYNQSLAFGEATVAADPKNALARVGLAITLRNIGDALLKQGDSRGALARYRTVLSLTEALAAEQPSDIQRRSQFSEMLVLVGTEMAKQGKVEVARPMTSRGLQIQRELADRAEASPDELKLYAMSLLECEPADLRNPPLALKYAQRALEVSDDKNPELLDLLAKAYFHAGKPADAVATEEKALALLPAPEPGKQPPPTRLQFESNLAAFKAGLK